MTTFTIKYEGETRFGKTYRAEWGTYRISNFDTVEAEAERVRAMGGVTRVWIEAELATIPLAERDPFETLREDPFEEGAR
jgi:hypothetical protein